MQSAPFDPTLTCPRCNAPANFSPTIQTCAGCTGLFWLHPGVQMMPSLVLPPAPPSPPLRVKSAGLFLMKQGEIGPYGVSEGTLDPVTGMIPIEQSGVAFHEIRSIAVWRTIDWIGLVGALLLLLPFTLGALVIAVMVGSWIWAVISLPFAFGLYVLIRRAVFVRAHWARIVGMNRAITVRFDRPGRVRKQFYAELLRRAGIPQAPELP